MAEIVGNREEADAINAMLVAWATALYQRALRPTRMGFPNRQISDSLCQTEVWHDESDIVTWRL